MVMFARQFNVQMIREQNGLLRMQARGMQKKRNLRQITYTQL